MKGTNYGSSGNHRRLASPQVPTVIMAVGTVLVLGLLSGVLFSLLEYGRVVEDVTHLGGLVSSLPFALWTVGAGYWLGGSDVSRSRYPRIVGWWVAGFLGFSLVQVAIIVTQPATAMSPDALIGVFFWLMAIGSGAGLVIGVVEARTIQGAVDIEGEAVRAHHLERQRDMFDYLNSILRHEVLNTVNVIEGYASLLIEDDSIEDPARTHALTIRRQADDLTQIIEDVQVLHSTIEGSAEFERFDLEDVLETEVRKLTDRYDGVSVEMTVPEDPIIEADGLDARIFGNILHTAVKHNDSPDPEIEIEVSVDESWVRVYMPTTGRGYPRTRFQNSSNARATRGVRTGSGSTSSTNLSTATRGISNPPRPALRAVRFASNFPGPRVPPVGHPPPRNRLIGSATPPPERSLFAAVWGRSR